MAWLRNTNRSRIEPSAEEPRKPDYDSQGKVRPIINYSSTHDDTESNHMIQTDFWTRRGKDGHYKLHNPPRVNLIKGGNVDNVSHFPPVMAHIGPPKKAGEFLPKEGQSSNPLERVKHRPFSSDDDYSSADESKDDYKHPTNYKHGDDWNTRYEGSHSPRAVRPNHVYDTNYGKESSKGNPNSTAFSSSPKKYTYHETTNNRVSPRRSRAEGDHIQSPRANWRPSFEPTSGGQPHYSSTAPKTDKQYERPICHIPLSRTKPESEASQSPKAVRTSPSHYETANNIKPAHENLKPQIEGRQPVIDSREAAKRYGGKATKGQIHEEEYKGTIDCKEAAKLYNGIFVP